MRECGKILYSRQYGVCTLLAGYLRVQTQNQSMWCLLFSTATMVARTRFIVTLYYINCLVCLYASVVIWIYVTVLQGKCIK